METLHVRHTMNEDTLTERLAKMGDLNDDLNRSLLLQQFIPDVFDGDGEVIVQLLGGRTGKLPRVRITKADGTIKEIPINKVPYYIRDLPGILEHLPAEAARFMALRIIPRDFKTPRDWEYKEGA